MVVGSKTRNFDNSYAWDITVCTSGTRPTAYEGRLIYETDTDKVMKCTNPVGPVWVEIVAGAGGLFNVVEDTTPQLGGDLDCNSKKITGVTEITTTTSILFKKV